MSSGIYMIRNKEIKERIYIGKSTNIQKRFSSHKNGLSRGNHGCSLLQYDFEKGLEFEYLIMEETEENLSQKEAKYLDLYYELGFYLYNMQSPKECSTFIGIDKNHFRFDEPFFKNFKENLEHFIEETKNYENIRRNFSEDYIYKNKRRIDYLAATGMGVSLTFDIDESDDYIHKTIFKMLFDIFYCDFKLRDGNSIKRNLQVLKMLDYNIMEYEEALNYAYINIFE